MHALNWEHHMSSVVFMSLIDGVTSRLKLCLLWSPDTGKYNRESGRLGVLPFVFLLY